MVDKTFAVIIPAVKAVDNGDGTFSFSIKDVNSNALLAASPIDSVSGARLGISFAHHETHEGDAYVCDYADDTLGDGDTINIVFKTGATGKKVHLTLGFTTLVGGELALWEGATWDTNTGTLCPLINRNRNSANVSTVLEDLSATPAFTVTGNSLSNVTGLNTGGATKVHHLHAWGDKKSPSIETVERKELILKLDTQYAIVFTADGGNNKAQVTPDWYEHTDSA